MMDKDSHLIFEMYQAKKKPIKYKDVEVDLIKTNSGTRLVKHGTDEDLDWRISGIMDSDKAQFIDSILFDAEQGRDVIPVKVDPIKSKGYMLHIMDIHDNES
tara:strand:+ start:5031 stop:5336 length:306 start_codon:yes stop_codon:yes gene_type:complete